MWITRQRARELAHLLLHTNNTPERTAAAFAVGVGVAFCPFLGFHTLIALLLAFTLRLNRLAVIAGTLASNPYTLVPIITFGTMVGSLILGGGLPRLPVPETTDFNSLGALSGYVGRLRPLFPQFFLGSSVLSYIAGLASYFLTLPVIKHLRQRRQASLDGRLAADEEI